MSLHGLSVVFPVCMRNPVCSPARVDASCRVRWLVPCIAGVVLLFCGAVLADTGAASAIRQHLEDSDRALTFGKHAGFAASILTRYRGRREPARITTRSAGLLLHGVVLAPLALRLDDASGLAALDDLLKGDMPFVRGFPTLAEAGSFSCEHRGGVTLNVTRSGAFDTGDAHYESEYLFSDCVVADGRHGTDSLESGSQRFNGRLVVDVIKRGMRVSVTGIVDGLEVVTDERHARQDGIIRQAGSGLSANSLDMIVLTSNLVTGEQYMESGTRQPDHYSTCMPAPRQVLDSGQAWHSGHGRVDVQQREPLAYDFAGVKSVPQSILAPWQFDCDALPSGLAGSLLLTGAEGSSLTLAYETLRDELANPRTPAALATIVITPPRNAVAESAQRTTSVTVGLDALQAGVLENLDDLDADGMLDGWEQWRGLNPSDTADAAADPDGDGITSLQEFRFHTDPGDPRSVRF